MSGMTLNSPGIVRALIVAVTVPLVIPSAAVAGAQGAGGKYQVVKACSLLSLAEVKKLAPWDKHLDAFAKAEEFPLDSYGSSCEYPTVGIQVMAFNRGTIDQLKKGGPVETVPGVGDEAYIRNNRGYFAEMAVRVGPHLLTVQLAIGPYKTFEATRQPLIEIGKAFAARLR